MQISQSSQVKSSRVESAAVHRVYVLSVCEAKANMRVSAKCRKPKRKVKRGHCTRRGRRFISVVFGAIENTDTGLYNHTLISPFPQPHVQLYRVSSGVNTRYFGNPNPTPGLTHVILGVREWVSGQAQFGRAKSLGTALETYMGYVSRPLPAHISVTSLFRVLHDTSTPFLANKPSNCLIIRLQYMSYW